MLDEHRIVIPSSYRQEILRQLHDDSHLTTAKITAFAENRYYWPTMKAEIKEISENCDTCIKFLPSRPNQPTVSDGPQDIETLDTIAVDHFHWGGADYLLAVDRYSGFIRVFQVKGTTTEETFDTLLEFFMDTGFPRTTPGETSRQSGTISQSS